MNPSTVAVLCDHGTIPVLKCTTPNYQSTETKTTDVNIYSVRDCVDEILRYRAAHIDTCHISCELSENEAVATVQIYTISDPSPVTFTLQTLDSCARLLRWLDSAYKPSITMTYQEPKLFYGKDAANIYLSQHKHLYAQPDITEISGKDFMDIVKLTLNTHLGLETGSETGSPTAETPDELWPDLTGKNSAKEQLNAVYGVGAAGAGSIDPVSREKVQDLIKERFGTGSDHPAPTSNERTENA